MPSTTNNIHNNAAAAAETTKQMTSNCQDADQRASVHNMWSAVSYSWEDPSKVGEETSKSPLCFHVGPRSSRNYITNNWFLNASSCAFLRLGPPFFFSNLFSSWCSSSQSLPSSQHGHPFLSCYLPFYWVSGFGEKDENNNFQKLFFLLLHY